MNADEWQRLVVDVTQRMLEHTRPFVVPLGKETETEVWLAGTASIVACSDSLVLLTCEHVARFQPLDHLPRGTTDFRRIARPFLSTPYPIDAALVVLDEADLAVGGCSAAAISYSRFDDRHRPVLGEILFFRGYAGENAPFAFETLDTKATGYCAQEPQSGEVEEIELLWQPSLSQWVTESDGRTMRKEDPGGFSGSLVWNTRFVEMSIQGGGDWSPNDAVVTGLLQRHDAKKGVLRALPVQHLRAWMDEVVPCTQTAAP